jgi:hypothetical protein
VFAINRHHQLKTRLVNATKTVAMLYCNFAVLNCYDYYFFRDACSLFVRTSLEVVGLLCFLLDSILIIGGL